MAAEVKTGSSKLIITIIFILALIHAAHSGLAYAITNFFESSLVNRDNILLFSYFLVGVALVFVVKPTLSSLELSFANDSRLKKTLYFCVTLVAVELIILSLYFYEKLTYSVVVSTILSVIVIPIFEELIFRGYLWSYLRRYFEKDFTIFIITTLLFAVWHIGYMDDILFRVTATGKTVNILHVMVFKVITGAFFGIILGYVKLITKNTYACILVHACMNLFGR